MQVGARPTSGSRESWPSRTSDSAAVERISRARPLRIVAALVGSDDLGRSPARATGGPWERQEGSRALRQTRTLILLATLGIGGCPGDDGPIDVTVGDPGTTSGPGGPGPFPGDPLTFYIEESIDFTNSNVAGCQNTDLNQVGDWVQDAFEDHDFTGTYTLDAAGTAYNFIDPAAPFGANGLDGMFADTRRVSVYAGHGNVNVMQWGNPGPVPAGVVPICQIGINQQMRLGTLTGDVSGFGMYVTSCTANTLANNLRLTLGQSQIGQHVGWHNSPAVSDFTPGAFVNQTATSIVDDDTVVPVTNRDAWMGIGQSQPGFAENSPVMYTTGATAAEVADRHFNARIALGIGIDEVIPEPQDPNVDTFSWVDNGCSNVCTGC